MTAHSFDTGGKQQRLRIPREWIERRLEQTSPELSKAAVEHLTKEKKSLLSEDAISLNCSLDLTYTSAEIVKITGKLKMPVEDLLQSVQADLVEGVTVRDPGWTTSEGYSKMVLLGTHWKLVVRTQKGRDSGNILTAIEHVERLSIPPKQVQFRPISLQFHPIYNEVFCDPDKLLQHYIDCKCLLDERQEAIHAGMWKLDETHRHRRIASKQILLELQQSEIDPAIRNHSQMHSIVRRKYSALKVMMDLLKLRSEQESYSTDAMVLNSDAILKTDAPVESHNQLKHHQSEKEPRVVSWHLQLSDPATAGVLRDGVRIELHCSDWSRPRRTRIVSVRVVGKQSIIKVNLPLDMLEPGEKVDVKVIPSFGMWAHQQAIQSLLNERVQGHWLRLAQLVCLSAPPPVSEDFAPPKQFFCDLDSGKHFLNERQRAAVAGVLAAPHFFCIQGPPGTGKTSVICESVQQLVKRGERVLLVAPSHVAVDEVLRRIGSQEGVRALRLSWEENRVKEDVRQFMPENIIDPFIEWAQKPNADKMHLWQQECSLISEAIVMLEKFYDSQKRRINCQNRKRRADKVLGQVRNNLANEQPHLDRQLKELVSHIKAAQANSSRLQKELANAEAVYRETLTKTGWVGKLLGWLGWGEIGRNQRWRRSVVRQYQRKKSLCDNLQKKKQATKNRLGSLRANVSDAEGKTKNASMVLSESIRDEQSAMELCARYEVLSGYDLYHETFEQMTKELQQRSSRLTSYQHLAKRFNELVAEAKEDGEDLEVLRRSLLAITNLFCCTTTGVAGSPQLRDLAFDTLIIDEASRVTDSGFLISAVRAKRWILVGDEHQLPPYVEQNDVHFIHALSALYQAETTGNELDKSVDDLGRLWEDEDEDELHQFRRDSVCDFAKRIIKAGHWQSTYRAAYQKRIHYLGNEVDDPSRSLLKAMRENLMHSLFERGIGSCPAELKVRLVEQRRMIEPIAAIVSEPVYDSDYRTPSPEELSQSGVTPLTTPTFPTPITFLDTSLLGKKARDELIRKSFVNTTEARWIVEACRTLDRELVQAGSQPVTVSILAFYKAQAKLISDSLVLCPVNKDL